MNRNILAVIVNELGGYDEAAEALGVDEDLIARAVAGENLTRAMNIELDGGWSDLQRDSQALDLYGLDLDKIDDLVKELEHVQYALQDESLSDDIRYAYADGRINAEMLESQGLDVFYDLTLFQSTKLIEWLLDKDNRHSAQGFVDAYLATRDRTGGIFSVDRDGSEFWEWMREHGLDDSA